MAHVPTVLVLSSFLVFVPWQYSNFFASSAVHLSLLYFTLHLLHVLAEDLQVMWSTILKEPEVVSLLVGLGPQHEMCLPSLS